MKFKKLLILVIIIIIIFTAILLKNTAKAPDHSAEKNQDLYESMNLFTSILYEIKKSYYKDISFPTLISYAIEGMLEKLDPYSSYLKKEDFESLSNYTNGEFYGVGIQFFKNKNNMIEVLHVIENSPAQKAGIKSGDIILSINNNPVSFLGVNEVSKRLQEKNQNIKIALSHENNSTYNTTLNKVKIKLAPIFAKTYQDILYIKIPSFNKNTSIELKKAINTNTNYKGVILDLRGNGGGLFNQAIEVADLFLNNKMIAQLENINTSEKELFMSTSGDILNNKPMIILIDGFTASSSEILSGSLQENKRALIVGTTSFGKGVVQDIMSLGNGDYIKLTTSEYFLPSNKKVNNKGVIPDVIIFKNGINCTKCSNEKLLKLKEQETDFIFKNYNNTTDNQLNSALKILQNEINKKG